jgi:TolB-like protein/Tfp pilus assembly protein PilF
MSVDAGPRYAPVRRSREDRLDSWKEIAQYLDRNVRTAQRWERTEQLPIRRHRHLKQGSVHAFKSDIDEWRKKREPLLNLIDSVEPQRDKRTRLAVLPFRNFGENTEDEFFADGLTEEMIAQLGRGHSSELGVIARTSVMLYKDSPKNIHEIGKELRVDAVLEGSVRRAGERMRVTAQLVRVSDQSHLWAENYDCTAADLLDVQSAVAEKIAKALELQLLPRQAALAAVSAPENSAAYEPYLRGRYYWNRRAEAEFFRAAEYFRRAIEIDPRFALAHCGLADIYSTLGWYGVLTGSEAGERAEACARRALEINPQLAEAHTSLAFVLHSFAWDWSAAEREYLVSLELNRNCVFARWWYAFFLAAMRRTEEAELQMKHALALDPLSLVLNAYYAWVLYFSRRYEEAVAQALKTLEMDKSFIIARFILGLSYARIGKGAASIREFQKARELGGENPLVLSGLAHTYGSARKPKLAKPFLSRLREFSGQQYVSPYHVAFGCVACGLGEEAIGELERGFEKRSSWLPLLQIEPGWDCLRKDSRFAALVERMNFPRQAVARSASA